ncbi:HAD family hydrolase [Aquibacillus koreensis]|uniref:HAD family hydrolase n=1 Tax=Aquibacillus koreensis TaxID=279446 RepID=A0A9X4AJX7_9BACI|nr:HAD family hydrolase [Aquibacillus koreensis]MCT2535495.1 HAD family hydrolase [Aquibacillus koreensis]MDC3422692.1 HAD family hydrolase [Aquibacillus koreensis]
MDSIIFDLDGTLWDSRNTIVNAWNKVVSREKQLETPITTDDLKQVMGLPYDEVGRRLLPDLEQDKQQKVLNACCEMENEYLRRYGGDLYETVEESLKLLFEKYQLYIVSNCQDGYIEAFYTYHKLEKYFQDYENPGRTGLSKAENIKLVMERNALSDPIYVGDTKGDQQAAKEVGIPFVYASYGFGKVNRCDLVIHKFDQLLELV